MESSRFRLVITPTEVPGLSKPSGAREAQYNVFLDIISSEFILADYLFSYYESQARHFYAISAFKIFSYYLIKVCGFLFVSFLLFFEKRVFLLI